MSKKGIVTTEEELALFEQVKAMCVAGGACAADVIWKDTTNYFNVSYRRPTHWFLRFFGDSRKRAIVTLVPLEEARSLASGFQVEVAPAAFGVSRVYLDSVEQVKQLGGLVLRSLALADSSQE